MKRFRRLAILASVGLAAAFTGHTAWSQSREQQRPATAAPTAESDDVVPSNHARSSLLLPPGHAGQTQAFGQEARTIDGSGNNVDNPLWGSAGTQLVRLVPAAYADGISAPAGPDRPSARSISNGMSYQSGPVPNPIFASDFVWQWGQFLDHDLDLAEIAEPVEEMHIEVPMGDPFFDPKSTGEAVIEMERAAYDPTTGTGAGNPREQMNFITSFVDASNVYGSDTVRAQALRTNDGTGKLKTSAEDLLPFNTEGLPNAGGTSPTLFLAGDVRANEQIALTVMHTLFVREHNRLCDVFAQTEPGLSGEELYQRARAVVGAQMQVITYNEFLPLLLGPNALAPYEGYDPSVNPGISNVFATACYRLGHSMLSPRIMRMDEEGNEIPAGHLALRDAFFAPDQLDNGGIEPILRGLASQQMEMIDGLVVDDVRNFLFGPPGAGGFDLASLNIQRGRDHGLADYNSTRVAFGLSPRTSFTEITSSATVAARLASLYDSVDDVDVWIGALAEDHMPDALVGELLMAVLKDQFERLRDGDRFWYQNVFSGEMLTRIESTRLSDIIRRNTLIGDEIQGNVFVVPEGNVAIPAVSAWGVAVMLLSLFVIGALVMERRKAS